MYSKTDRVIAQIEIERESRFDFQLRNYYVNIVTKCWVWLGAKDKDGYGKVKRYQKSVRAHRVFYEHHIGEIPEGLLVLHRCDNPSCVNPAHLFAGTQFDNEADKDKKLRRINGYGQCMPNGKMKCMPTKPRGSKWK